MPLAIGIAFGTTRSYAAAYINEEVIVISQGNGKFLPSVVSFTENKILIGHLAEEAAIVNPENTIYGIKRIIGKKFDDSQLQEYLKTVQYKVENVDGYPKISVNFKGEKRLYDPEWITSLILKKLKTNAEINLGIKVISAVITVPAFFSDSQRQAVKNAAVLAGLNVLQIMNASTSIAIAYGLDRMDKKEKYILIFDFGSGKFSASILLIKPESVFETIAAVGDGNLGSFEMITAIVNYCTDVFYKDYQKDIKNDTTALGRLWYACRRAMTILANKTETVVIVDAIMDGIDLQINVSRSKAEELCEGLINRAIELLHQLVNDSGIDKNDIDDVLFVGGCTKSPKVRHLVSQYFDGRHISRSFDNRTAIACGAAFQAAQLTGHTDSRMQNIMCIDVTPLSIGIETADGLMTTVIERNTSIPTEAKYTVTTLEDNQTNVTVRVFEGERALVSNNVLLGTLELHGLPPLPQGVPKIELVFKIDSNGILTVSAEERSSMEFEEITINFEKGGLSNRDIQRMLEEADEFSEEDERTRNSYRASLDKYVRSVSRTVFANKDSKLRDRDKVEIARICNEVRDWLELNLAADTQDILQKTRDARLLLAPYYTEIGNPKMDKNDIEKDSTNCVSDASSHTEKNS